jgi:hypothetical protein
MDINMQDYEKFKQIYAEIDELIKKQVTSEDAEFITWHTRAERFIINSNFPH